MLDRSTYLAVRIKLVENCCDSSVMAMTDADLERRFAIVRELMQRLRRAITRMQMAMNVVATNPKTNVTASKMLFHFELKFILSGD